MAERDGDRKLLCGHLLGELEHRMRVGDSNESRAQTQHRPSNHLSTSAAARSPESSAPVTVADSSVSVASPAKNSVSSNGAARSARALPPPTATWLYARCEKRSRAQSCKYAASSWPRTSQRWLKTSS